ncbi:uncharacterized protein LOC127283130 [Leptopilina boulardi]|uniref:uncharacterized protein LOC127283130 n=1 Tax=Leptopilina boulardi TaxID=63433 RepID=UPI0021F64B2A|nr:uncharacterized protein LOC127283130 [Leptopilina boulardi]
MYNYYRLVRKDFREADILTDENSVNEISDQSASNLTSVVTSCPESSSLTEISKYWEDTFKERRIKLQEKEKKTKTCSLQTYFRSFECLKAPLGLSLLEQDFYTIAEEIYSKKKEKLPDYSKLLLTEWPILAKKILLICEKSKAVDVKQFVLNHAILIKKGTHDSILALMVLPLILRSAPKKVELNSGPVTVTKQESSKCFILHIQNADDLNDEQNSFETWLIDRSQEIYPYLIFLGNVENPQISIVVNSERYAFTDPLKAIDCCFKCLIALDSFSFLCDFVWLFLDKVIYKLDYLNTKNTWVTKFVVDLKKL